MAKFRKLGRAEGFEEHWPHIDTDTWPGRELKFLYCHPIIASVIICTALAELFIWIKGY